MLDEVQPSGHWLTPKRIRFYSVLVLGFFLVFFAGYIRFSNLVDPNGYTLISDFSVFWIASHIGLTGNPADAYNPTYLHQAFKSLSSNITSEYGWFYPPTFYLLILPFSWIPHFASYLAFMGSTLALYILGIRQIIWNREVFWALIAFPGIWLNILRGQNGFLTAALAGVTLTLLPRRPVAAGIFLGLISIKPHLGLLFPVALVAVGAWRTLAWAAVSCALFMAASVAILGVPSFEAWVRSMGYASTLLETTREYWLHMPTVFASLRLMGISLRWAFGLHCIVAFLALYAVWAIWRKSHSRELRNSALVASTMLFSPYLFEYDLTWLALPLAWLSVLASKQGWLRWEREVLVAAWSLPIVMRLVASATAIQVGPIGLLALLWMIWRRFSHMESCSRSRS
jgi:hypothetical protein